MNSTEYDMQGRMIDRVTLAVRRDIYGYMLSCEENHNNVAHSSTIEGMNNHLTEIIAHNFEAQYLTMHMVRYYTVIWYL
jgi:hypothetical protein